MIDKEMQDEYQKDLQKTLEEVMKDDVLLPISKSGLFILASAMLDIQQSIGTPFDLAMFFMGLFFQKHNWPKEIFHEFYEYEKTMREKAELQAKAIQEVLS